MRRQVRTRTYREYVLPVLQRFAWVFEQRGELPKGPKIGGEYVTAEHESPLSKASNIDEANTALEFSRNVIGIFGEAALGNIDVSTTIERIREKMNVNLIEVSDEPQQPVQQAQPPQV